MPRLDVWSGEAGSLWTDSEEAHMVNPAIMLPATQAEVESPDADAAAAAQAEGAVRQHQSAADPSPGTQEGPLPAEDETMEEVPECGLSDRLAAAKQRLEAASGKDCMDAEAWEASQRLTMKLQRPAFLDRLDYDSVNAVLDYLEAKRTASEKPASAAPERQVNRPRLPPRLIKVLKHAIRHHHKLPGIAGHGGGSNH